MPDYLEDPNLAEIRVAIREAFQTTRFGGLYSNYMSPWEGLKSTETDEAARALDRLAEEFFLGYAHGDAEAIGLPIAEGSRRCVG